MYHKKMISHMQANGVAEELHHVQFYNLHYTVKKKLLNLRDNSSSCGYQSFPVKSTVATF